MGFVFDDFLSIFYIDETVFTFVVILWAIALNVSSQYFNYLSYHLCLHYGFSWLIMTCCQSGVALFLDNIMWFLDWELWGSKLIFTFNFFVTDIRFVGYIGDPCEGPVCGRGTCVPLNNNTLGFECECEPGWRQARPEEDIFAKFLPCVIPNCKFSLLFLFFIFIFV